MTGKILQINTSRGGIPKRTVDPGLLTPRGIDGDDWAHPQFHGGPNQALLLIGMEVLEELRNLDYPVYPGALGENLTTAGLDYARLQAGQRWRVGATGLIELTKLREPCRTLEVYNIVGIPKIQKLLKEAGRGGFYARVIEGATLFPGDPLQLVDQLV